MNAWTTFRTIQFLQLGFFCFTWCSLPVCYCNRVWLVYITWLISITCLRNIMIHVTWQKLPVASVTENYSHPTPGNLLSIPYRIVCRVHGVV